MWTSDKLKNLRNLMHSNENFHKIRILTLNDWIPDSMSDIIKNDMIYMWFRYEREHLLNKTQNNKQHQQWIEFYTVVHSQIRLKHKEIWSIRNESNTIN